MEQLYLLPVEYFYDKRIYRLIGEFLRTAPSRDTGKGFFINTFYQKPWEFFSLEGDQK